MLRSTIAFFTLLLGCALTLPASPESPADKPFTPRLAAASDEAQRAIKGFRNAAGLEVNVFAAEPMVAHPVQFCFDEHGRCYVAETFRVQAGVTDNRGHMYWLDDDLASRTVADRVALYRKHLKDKFSTYEVAHDR